ncbi:ATP-binding cassette sub- G member 2, partial [Lunasporangiospora selenospora]
MRRPVALLTAFAASITALSSTTLAAQAASAFESSAAGVGPGRGQGLGLEAAGLGQGAPRLAAMDSGKNALFRPPGGVSLSSPLLYSMDPKRPEDCPPCFNCLLDAFPCSHFAPCNAFDGRCSCPPGFAGDDCSVP